MAIKCNRSECMCLFGGLVWDNNVTSTNNNVCIASTVLYKYMKSLIKYVHNVSDNTHVREYIYREIYHDIVHIANGSITSLT